jgi:citrate lyase subunit beta/citryl-CoA lyase
MLRTVFNLWVGIVADWLAVGGSAAVRVNAADTPWFADDLAAIGDFGCAIMLPKASVDDVAATVARLGDDSRLLVLIETAAGIIDAPSICASPSVIRAAFGSIDPRHGDRGESRRSRCALPYPLHGGSRFRRGGIAPPLDGVTTDLTSGEPARADAEYAARLGFTGKLCIHPVQIGPVNAAFEPSAEQIAWARKVLDAVGDGALKVDGHMIDAPVLERARRLLARHEMLIAPPVPTP